MASTDDAGEIEVDFLSAESPNPRPKAKAATVKNIATKAGGEGREELRETIGVYRYTHTEHAPANDRVLHLFLHLLACASFDGEVDSVSRITKP